jgi:hypothetical protein
VTLSHACWLINHPIRHCGVPDDVHDSLDDAFFE